MSPDQIKLIHIAKGAARLNDAQYRTLLFNMAGVQSSKQLDNVGFEDVMAVLEDMGFADRVHGAQYWRGKVRARGAKGNERMVRKINAMGRESRYELTGLARRFSANRTSCVEELTPRECWELIEMLKASIEREKAKGPKLFNTENFTAEDAEDRRGNAIASLPPRTSASSAVNNSTGVTDGYDDEIPF